MQEKFTDLKFSIKKICNFAPRKEKIFMSA
jgi:hypothetical protein